MSLSRVIEKLQQQIVAMRQSLRIGASIVLLIPAE